MRDLSVYVGNKIKLFRESRGMTQSDLAEKLNTSRQSISRYETGERKANQDILFELSEVLGVNISDFFPTNTKTSSLNLIYDRLIEPRQKKVYKYAEQQLKDQNKVISIEETDFNDEYQGQAAAGLPIEGQQAIPFIGAETVSLLVNGDSMEGMFYDGDIIEYHPQPELENGEIGVFAVNGGITLKKFRRNDDIRLESLNKKYQDIVIKETDDFNILGKVIM